MKKQRFYFSVITALGIIGIFIAAWAHYCALMHAKEIADTLLRGIPMSFMGGVGYSMIALTAFIARSSKNKWGLFPILNYGLIAFASGFTIFLIVKAGEVELVCPACILSWVLTGIILVMTLFRLIRLIFARSNTVEAICGATCDKMVGPDKSIVITSVYMDCSECGYALCPHHPEQQS